MASFNIDRIRFRWKGKWTLSAPYTKDDIVYYNSKAYVCLVGHESDDSDFYNDLNSDVPKWELMLDGNSWTGDWETETKYSIGDIVKFKSNLYQCIDGHTSTVVSNAGPESSNSKWKIVAVLYNWKGNWAVDTFYNKGDVVKYNGILYISSDAHRSASTFTSGILPDSEKWNIVTRSDKWLSDWQTSTDYKLDDVVRYGAIVYRCTAPHTSADNFTSGLEQDSTNWEPVVEGIEYTGEWATGKRYRKYDIVRKGNSVWICNTHHTSVSTNFKSDEQNWSLWLPGLGFEQTWDSEENYNVGDIVLHGGYTYTALTNNVNSIPSVNGKTQNTGDWELLTEGYTHQGDWSETESYKTGDVVRNNGYLYVAVDDGLNNIPDESAKWELLSEGLYWTGEWKDESAYVLGDVVTFKSSSYYCIVEHTAGNTTRPDNDQVSVDPNVWQALILGTSSNVLATRGDIRTHNGTEHYALEIGEPGQALKTSTAVDPLLWESIGQVSNVFYVANEGRDIPENGKSVSSPFKTVNYACSYILNNVDTSNVNTTVFVKTGLYEEVLPISIPANCAILGDELRSTSIMPGKGYEQYDMFYVRNGSGIRNMTLQGLYGVLGSLTSTNTRRPSAGAYVSLDPGNGINDESVWIKTKSPYIQNVTTFGTACIGMKIDGSLHSGGNRSIVANDFTQVISDGIGYWADNLGRSELVSVFTYFCYIGYLSTNGGILRATNGNNSYGVFGSRAEGYNREESPITAQVDNQSFDAQVDVVHTNGSEILAVGFSHAGQEYDAESTSISFTGTGANASASFAEARNNALSELRVLDPEDSSFPGGLNYQNILNSAQGGSGNTIILSTADTFGTAERYVGMRIFIEAGRGAGQYGIITGYNETTKEALISREFDEGPGWEHINPGKRAEATLDNTTRYRIEPRVIFEEPPVESSVINVGIQSNSWKYITSSGAKSVAVTSGGTGTAYATYSDLSGENWNTPVSIGSDYTIAGIEYTGENYIILRRSLNSNTAHNTILKSTNGENWITETLPVSSIFSSIASNKNGNVIITSESDQTVLYSQNYGVTWATSTLGTSQTWSKSCYGNGRFVVLEESGNGDVAYSDDNGATWTITPGAMEPGLWNKVIYGKGRFVALDDNNTTSISFDGITWSKSYEKVTETTDTYNTITYGAGVFLSFGNSPIISKSHDGVVWKTFGEDSTLYTTQNSGNYSDATYYDNKWIVIQDNTTSWGIVTTGATPIVRASIKSSRVDKFVIYDPGSNLLDNIVVSVFDNLNTINVMTSARINDSVLTQPVFTNRGVGYNSASALISGNGFADIYQSGNTLIVKNLSKQPGPGDNLVINGIDDVVYKVTAINDISGQTGDLTAKIDISPSIGNFESPSHEESMIIRQEYSQVRLTGHDFLDIGTGNVNSTRYPELYVFGKTSENEPRPQNEVSEIGGGRVFYTSTDQNGNFRVGELFKVEQTTGIVTISSDFFDLQGLTEISLGGITVGGSAVVIKEFSKEPTFVANSNSIIPTQKAIASYLESRITGGSSSAITNTLIAGEVSVTNNTISTKSDNPIEFPTLVEHTGGISGDYLAMQYFGLKRPSR